MPSKWLFREAFADTLEKHEGKRLDLYRCPAGKWTIGVGHNLQDNGIDEETCYFILLQDIKRVEQELDLILEGWREMTLSRQLAVASLLFWIGANRFLGFKRMRAALVEKDYDRAADELLDSKLAREYPKRAKELAGMLRNGPSVSH